MPSRDLKPLLRVVVASQPIENVGEFRCTRGERCELIEPDAGLAALEQCLLRPLQLLGEQRDPAQDKPASLAGGESLSELLVDRLCIGVRPNSPQARTIVLFNNPR